MENIVRKLMIINDNASEKEVYGYKKQHLDLKEI